MPDIKRTREQIRELQAMRRKLIAQGVAVWEPGYRLAPPFTRTPRERQYEQARRLLDRVSEMMRGTR